MPADHGNTIKNILKKDSTTAGYINLGPIGTENLPLAEQEPDAI